MRRLLVSFPAALAVLASCVPSTRPADPSAVKGWIVDEIVRVAEEDVFGMPIDAHVFHYAPANKDVYLDPLANWTGAVNAATARAFPKDKPGWNAKRFPDWYSHNGFYASLTPASSRNYGAPGALRTVSPDYKHPWALYRVELRKGTRVLDIVGDRALPEDVVDTLEESFSCPATTVEQLFLMMDDKYRGCRDLVSPVLRGLKVTALLYGWQQRNRRRSDYYCAKHTTVAFLLTGPLPSGSVRVYSRALPEGGSDEAHADRLMIEAVFGSLRGVPDGKLWSEIQGTLPSAAEREDYVREHQFGCGAL